MRVRAEWIMLFLKMLIEILHERYLYICCMENVAFFQCDPGGIMGEKNIPPNERTNEQA